MNYPLRFKAAVLERNNEPLQTGSWRVFARKGVKKL